MIPVVNNEFYPRFLCLHSSVLCKDPVTSLYLASLSPNFLIVFCIKSLMLDLTNHIQILHNLSCVHLSVNSSDALPTCPRDPFHADKGIQRVCGTQVFNKGEVSLGCKQSCLQRQMNRQTKKQTLHDKEVRFQHPRVLQLLFTHWSFLFHLLLHTPHPPLWRIHTIMSME